jgi:F-box domain
MIRNQIALKSAIEDLEIRSEVEEAMRAMLIDLEITNWLESQVAIENERHNLLRRAAIFELALEEARLKQKDEDSMREELGDKFVAEILDLNEKLAGLNEIKSEHETALQDLEKLNAKLALAEKEIADLKSGKGTQGRLNSNIKNDSKIEIPLKASPFMISDQVGEKYSDTKELGSRVEDENSLVPKDVHAYGGDYPDPLPNKSRKGVVSLVIGEEGESPHLPTFEGVILLRIFSFLDAVDILRLAQVSIGMYSRIDTLYANNAEDVEEPALPTEIETERKIVEVLMLTQPTMVQMPPPAPIQATVVNLPPPPVKNLPVAQLESRKNVARGLISLFQTNTTSNSEVKQSKSTESSNLPLTAAMANSMAEKMSDKEINVIINMTEKLNKKNKDLEIISQQNLELRSSLDGANAVKEFLVKKVREMEESLRKNKELEIKTAQMIASDQEVIAFLDGRVQELEMSEAALSAEKKALSEQITDHKDRSEKKVRLLNDMLQYERERSAENEREWKSTRKVLIKEVKCCRNLITTLQAERDGLYEENIRLKQSILASTGSPISVIREDSV